MNRSELINEVKTKKSFLCVGLDSDISKLPQKYLTCEDPVFSFNRDVIDQTKDYAVAYKMNIAFYESLGPAGWQSLEKTLNYIPDNIFKIADAKRGDIGNTSKQYAKTFFETYDFDSITVSPYMGVDSISPFLEFENKWVIILALTSNKGSEDFQFFDDGKQKLYERVLEISQTWGDDKNIMYVVGATHPEAFADIRKIIPNHFILIPGIGAQGGDFEKVVAHAKNDDYGMLINVSRGIIFPKTGEFPKNIGVEAKKYHDLMSKYF
jgi:orotidine-5'-phosphate decarboxylase